MLSFELKGSIDDGIKFVEVAYNLISKSISCVKDLDYNYVAMII